MELLVDYDFMAIFDADFKPEPDFLVRHVTRQRTCIGAPMCPVNPAIFVKFISAFVW